MIHLVVPWILGVYVGILIGPFMRSWIASNDRALRARNLRSDPGAGHGVSHEATLDEESTDRERRDRRRPEASPSRYAH